MRALAVAVLVLCLSCNDAPTARPPGPYHIFRATAVTAHDTLQSFCAIEGALPVSAMSLPPWTGTGTITAYRYVATTHGVIASRHTDLSVSFSATQDASGLLLTLGPPLNDTLTGSVVQVQDGPTNGSWICPSTFPFASDSFLLSHGYDPAPAPSGTWTLQWMGGAIDMVGN